MSSVGWGSASGERNEPVKRSRHGKMNSVVGGVVSSHRRLSLRNVFDEANLVAWWKQGFIRSDHRSDHRANGPYPVYKRASSVLSIVCEERERHQLLQDRDREGGEDSLQEVCAQRS